MKDLFNLFSLFCMVSVCQGQSEIENEPQDVSLADKAKAFLQHDPIPLKIVEKF